MSESSFLRSDPTQLTTEQLLRELRHLRDTIETRLSAMDKATELSNENFTRVPTDTDKQISHLKALHAEKFTGIQLQFHERDVRSAAAEDAAKVAVNAALQAQKEAAAAQNASNATAIAKSENATLKQIDGILALLGSNNIALNDKITVINGRLDRGEGKETGHTTTISSIIAISVAAAAIIGLAISFMGPSRSPPGSIAIAPPATVTTNH